MSNTLGHVYKMTIWGQSHAPAIGVVIEGLPAGTRIDPGKLQQFMDRRRPGQNALSTARKETDRVEFLAGFLPEKAAVSENAAASENADCPENEAAPVNATAPEDAVIVTCGAPLTAMIRNGDTRSKDYENLRYVPRPGHADYTAMVKYGEARDYAGGGQFSGRMTAPLCIAGGIALQILEARGIHIEAVPVMVGGETDPDKMQQAVETARVEGDSVGGVVECVITGVPAGLGEPMFDGIENRIAQAVFGIPAVKGIEFGSGFAGSALRGSQNNDAFIPAPHDNNTETKMNGDGVSAMTATNNHGGILGGITSGMPIVFRAAFKPTPSIAKPQQSIDIRTGEAVTLTVKGRHDPCIVYRAVPCVEAAAAAVILDLLLEEGM